MDFIYGAKTENGLKIPTRPFGKGYQAQFLGNIVKSTSGCQLFIWFAEKFNGWEDDRQECWRFNQLLFHKFKFYFGI
jgi:hypothetical protein